MTQTPVFWVKVCVTPFNPDLEPFWHFLALHHEIDTYAFLDVSLTPKGSTCAYMDVYLTGCGLSEHCSICFVLHRWSGLHG